MAHYLHDRFKVNPRHSQPGSESVAQIVKSEPDGLLISGEEVTVWEVPHHTKKQKGVDFTVFIRMMTLARSPLQPHEIVLFASDTDYVPALRLLAEQGTYVVIVGFKAGTCPLNEGLVNESYLSLDLDELLENMEQTSDNQRLHRIARQSGCR